MSTPNSFTKDPGSMIAVDIATFIKGSKLPTSIYLKLSDTKYVLVAREGEDIPIDQFEKYKRSGILFVYVDRHLYSKLVDKNILISNFLIKREDLNDKTKNKVLQNAAKGVFQEIGSMKLNQTTYEHSKQIVDATMSIVTTRTDFTSLLEQLQKCDGSLVEHSLAVSMFSIMIARSLDWLNAQTLQKLALGALLHDIGKKELPPDLLAKPRSEMTYEETVQYENHAYRGMVILQGIDDISDDVVKIVYQHHEVGSGQGYPQRLKDLKIHPMAKVVALANTFAELTLKHSNSAKQMSPEAAVNYIENVMGQPYNRQIFRALKNLVEKQSSKAS